MDSPSPDSGRVVPLADVLDIKAAAGLHAELMAMRGDQLVLDASAVRQLGGQCLQVLLAGVSAWRADGQDLSFANPSEAFIQGLDLFGVRPDRLCGTAQTEPVA